MERTPENWKRIKALFEAALAEEASSRTSFLDRVCPDSDDRERVEKLLADHQEAGSFLSDPVFGRGIRSSASSSYRGFDPEKLGFGRPKSQASPDPLGDGSSRWYGTEVTTVPFR